MQPVPRPKVELIHDLLGTILVLGACTVAFLLEFTRRKMLSVSHLAFISCSWISLFVFGGLVDHFISERHLQWALITSFNSSRPFSMPYIYLPMTGSVLITVIYLFQTSICSCRCCCLEENSTYGAVFKTKTHHACFWSRVRSCGPIYIALYIWLFICIGMRLNVRLRESAIHPAGGTLHWEMLTAPFYLSCCHIGTVALLGLKSFLQHADQPSSQPQDRNPFPSVSPASSTQKKMQLASTSRSNNSTSSTSRERTTQPIVSTDFMDDCESEDGALRAFSSKINASVPESPVSTESFTSSFSISNPSIASSMTSTRSRTPSLRNPQFDTSSNMYRSKASSISSKASFGHNNSNEDIYGPPTTPSRAVTLRYRGVARSPTTPPNKLDSYTASLWTEYYDAGSDKLYYHNRITGESRWKV